MKTLANFNAISQLAFAAALCALVGCASSNYQKGAATSADILEAANKIEVSKTNVTAVLTSMNDLVKVSQGNLVPKYSQFVAAVGNLRSSAANSSNTVVQMRAQGTAYFDAWDQQLAQIRNEDIKKESEARRQAVQKQFNDIRTSYTDVQKSFDPFMSNVSDIQTALGTDLTTGGIASVKGAVNTANKHGDELKTALNKLSAEFRELGLAMSTSAPAPASTTNTPPQ